MNGVDVKHTIPSKCGCGARVVCVGVDTNTNDPAPDILGKWRMYRCERAWSVRNFYADGIHHYMVDFKSVETLPIGTVVTMTLSVKGRGPFQ